MKKIIFITLIITLFQLQNIYAKEVFNKMEAGQKNLYIGFEFDPTFAGTIGYATSFKIDSLNRNLTLAWDITLPIFLFDLKHYRVEMASRIPFFNSESWNILNRFSLINKGTDNGLYYGNNISIEQGFLMGYFGKSWFIAADISYEKFLVTYIEHTALYRNLVYSDAKNGWYSSTGGNFNFGLQTGYSFSKTIEATIRCGLYQTEDFNNPVGVPFFANLGLNYRF